MFSYKRDYTVSRHDFGGLRVSIYDFPKSGDALPMHNHKSGGAHISIVARGSFIAKGAGWEADMPLGAVVDFDADKWHEFTAKEDNSRLVNIIK